MPQHRMKKSISIFKGKLKVSKLNSKIQRARRTKNYYRINYELYCDRASSSGTLAS